MCSYIHIYIYIYVFTDSWMKDLPGHRELTLDHFYGNSSGRISRLAKGEFRSSRPRSSPHWKGCHSDSRLPPPEVGRASSSDRKERSGRSWSVNGSLSDFVVRPEGRAVCQFLILGPSPKVGRMSSSHRLPEGASAAVTNVFRRTHLWSFFTAY